MDNIRIVVDADSKSIQATTESLEKLGKVDQKNADQFKKHHDESKKHHKEQVDLNTKLTHSFEELGEGIIAAFAVEKIIEFGAECIKEFEEVQKAEKNLEFAVKNLAGEGSKAFQELKEQSESLSKSLKTLFTSKDIQQGQETLIRVAKLSSDEVLKIMPRIADIAAKKNKTIQEISDSLGRAIGEGNTKALTDLGLKFKDTGSVVGNFNKVMKESEKYIGGAADSMQTLAAQEQMAKNRMEELEVSIGSKLAPAFVKLKTMLLSSVEGLFEFSDALKDTFTDSESWTEKASNLMAKGLKVITYGLIDIKTVSETVAKLQAATKEEAMTAILQANIQIAKSDNETVKQSFQKIVDAGKARIIQLLKQGEEELQTREGIDKHIRDNEKKFYYMSEKQLIAYQKLIEQHEKEFSVTGFEAEQNAIKKLLELRDKAGKDRLKQEQDLQKELDAIHKRDVDDRFKIEAESIEDEYLKKRALQEDQYRREDEELDLRRKRLEEITKIGNNSEIAQAQKEIKEVNKIKEELKFKSELDLAKIDEDHQKQVADKAKRDEIELAEIRIKYGEIENKRAFIAGKKTKEEYDKENKELEIQLLEDTLKIKRSYGEEEVKLEQEIINKKLDLEEKSKDKTKEFIKDFNEFTQKILEGVEKAIENNITAIDTMNDKQNRMIDQQKILAERGLTNDLAFEERRADEMTKKKLEEQKKLKQVKELETFLNSVAKFAEDNPKTAVGKALAVLATTKIAETVFMEEGGIIGKTNGVSSFGLNAFSRRHKSGNDVILHAEKGEGVLSVKEMNNLGHDNFNILKSMLRTPFHEKNLMPAPVVSVFNDKNIINRLDSLEQAIINKKETHVDFENMYLKMTEIENGITRVTKVKPRRI